MKQFFASLLGSLLGVLLSVFVVVIIIAGIISSAMSDEKKTDVKENSVLHLKFDGPIIEREPKNEFSKLTGFSDEKKMGLDMILASIKKAKEDKNIKGIFLEASIVDGGLAAIEEIRDALSDFKSSGKFIYSYGEMYSQKGYYLSSVANTVAVHPEGAVDFKGLGAQVMFFKKMLEKLDINVQIFRHGKFKSAVEPFDLEKMSEANRLQTLTYISSLWNHMIGDISESRKVSTQELNDIASGLKIRTAADAVTYKLADKTAYFDEVTEELKKKCGIDTKAKLALVSPERYKDSKSDDSEEKVSRNKIAVVFAVGSIESGEGDDETIGSDRIAKAIRDAREDENVKAIVLRVNSPGGSALASDVIWREVVLAKKKKPVIVSMGDVAASGGYYISCAADMILAEPTTITGSIGVFGLLPEAGTLMSERLGITMDTVNTNRHAGMGNLFYPLDTMEAAVMQESVEQVYTTFITRVAEGRKMTTAEVDSIGQGRVWSGVDALRIGLVDSLGGLETAIIVAAKKAGLGDDYRVQKLPAMKDPFEEFLGEKEEELETAIVQRQLGILKNEYLGFLRNRTLLNCKGVQARMPYELILE